MSNNFLSGIFGKKKKAEEAPLADDQTNAHINAENSDKEAPHQSEPTSQPPEADAPIAPPEPEAQETTQQVMPPSAAAPDTSAISQREPIAQEGVEQPEEKKSGWLSRLTQGLSKSSSKLTEGVSAIFTKRKLDDGTIEELEDLLITSDLGVPAAAQITTALAKDRYDKEISDTEVKEALANEIASILTPLEKPLTLNETNKPHVILMIGVNGAGKTTTIGKLAQKFKADGKSVMLAAGDTFRAAAIEQLTVWGERTNTPVIARDVGADAAGLAFDAVKAAQEAGSDVLMIDTAGRLQNKTALMDELAKIVRVLKKLDETAPHDVVLVLDATVGQNAISQAQVFSDVAGVTGLVMTKLDGTARGGVLVALAEKFKLPIHYIGVGEDVDDLQDFKAINFAKALVGAGE
ncbi:MAG: hypothetical protein DHS20C05_08440 [Hyphococcus sp.]|nr:MAG: hypothetical protein DHS20C05_08440 [Marinicaulis sp.]